MLFKPKDELDNYHDDCSYGRSGSVTPYKKISIPVEIMNLCVIHVGHSIFCRRHELGTRYFRHLVLQDESFLSQSIFKQQSLAVGFVSKEK